MRMIQLKTPLLRAFALMAFSAVSFGGAVAGGFSAENSIKAAFVYNIAKLTTWPSNGGSLVIGLVGSSGAGDAIESVVDGKDVDGRKIQVKHISAGDAKSCQIVFICGSGSAPSLGGAPVLTVGESSGFSRSSGAVGLVVNDGKVQVEINMGNVKKAGLKVSQKLISIAKLVD